MALPGKPFFGERQVFAGKIKWALNDGILDSEARRHKDNIYDIVTFFSLLFICRGMDRPYLSFYVVFFLLTISWFISPEEVHAHP
ncbi:hypothetical protein DS275_20715 [Salmonella enterica subsp. salamae serovar Sofia]|nr:hypothetical protein [Salmonella enterica subsp. salamae serovar Sofia]